MYNRELNIGGEMSRKRRLPVYGKEGRSKERKNERGSKKVVNVQEVTRSYRSQSPCK
jgi:hypothetical protein